MRPKDLKYPFTGKEKHVLLSDRVWHIPKIEQPAPVPVDWSHSDLFGNDNPVCIEYCSGNGAWIVERAKSNPQFNWIAVEMKFDRTRKIWSKIKNLQLNNLLVICAEACYATKYYFPDNSISAIYINFPDPWPKNRHAKFRLINNAFVAEMQRILIERKTFTFVTDDVPYSDWTIRVMQTQQGFECCHQAPFYINDLEGYGSSYFNELWKSKGREIRFHEFQKKSTST